MDAMAEPVKCDAELDATGLICPLPVLRANRALKSLPVGARLKVRATDPAAKSDFPAYCRTDRKSTRLNSSHIQKSRMPSSA